MKFLIDLLTPYIKIHNEKEINEIKQIELSVIMPPSGIFTLPFFHLRGAKCKFRERSDNSSRIDCISTPDALHVPYMVL